MEKRLIIAVLLMMAVVYIVNILFPPARPPEPVGDAVVDTVSTTRSEEPEARVPVVPEPVPSPDLRAQVEPLAREEADTVWVETATYRFGFSTIGARLVSAQLLDYESLAGDSKGEPVELIRSGSAGMFAHAWLVGDDTLDFSRAKFSPRPAAGLDQAASQGDASLSFVYEPAEVPFTLELRYTFHPDGHAIDLTGAVSGVRPTGWWLLDMGEGLESNEWDPPADYKEYLSFVGKGANGPKRVRFRETEPGAVTNLDGPFDWVAVHTKYFVVALVRPTDATEAARFAGLQVRGLAGEYRARGRGSFPLGRDGTFAYGLYVGPMVPRELRAMGHDLNDVAPYGYRWLQPIIRPLSVAITDLLEWSHRVLGLGYGWILILFGIGIRIVLFPLYQKSMRSQMATMQVQPLMKEIQTKYKSDPQKLQQEMMKLYREHKINPLGGCLPMLLPFPILIALFFVFKDTIEFRGVPFLWLPDLSRADPLYIIPVLMGASLFVLQWIGQRGMPQDNPQMKQMKMLMYVMPVMMVVLFLNFASGLNLYYATMNIASLPQQLYVARERRAAMNKGPAKVKT